MIMELMSGGQLFSETLASGGLQCADNPKGMPESKIRGYFRQILLGLAYCHGRGIAHRDIKLENLLLCEDKTTVKIADFGLAKVSTGADKTILGTCKYMAPEMFEGAGGDGNDHRLCDIWAAGVCLFAMTECGFAFHVGGNGGAASGAEGRQWAGQNDIKLMNAIRSARSSSSLGARPSMLPSWLGCSASTRPPATRLCRPCTTRGSSAKTGR